MVLAWKSLGLFAWWFVLKLVPLALTEVRGQQRPSISTPDYFCMYSQATLRYTIWKWSFLSGTKTAFMHGHLLYHHFWKPSSVTDSLYLIIGANFWESVQAEPCSCTILKRLSLPTGEFKQIDSLQPSCKRMCGGQHNKHSGLWKLVFHMCRSSYQG